MGQKASKKAAAETSGGREKTPSSTSIKSTSEGPVRGRLSAQFSRLTSVRGRRAAAAAATAAATSRLQLEQRLSEAIKAKAAGGSHPKVKFNRLLLRFGSLHEGFAACRKVFAQWAGSDEGELSEARLRDACSTLGYTLDAATLDKIFVSADMDASNTLNQHEFLVVLAILHILKGPEDVERVNPVILRSLQTAEEAFMSFDSSAKGHIDKGELMGMMHESGTDHVRHFAGVTGGDPISSIAAQRFAELDKDGSGRVSFIEFLFCLEGWVEETEEDEVKSIVTRMNY